MLSIMSLKWAKNAACVISVLCLLCFRAHLFIDALWSPAGKGLTSWLSFVKSNYESVTFHLVSRVRCGTWLYRFLILAPLLLNWLSGFWNFYVHVLLVNFCFKCIPSCNSPEMYTASWTDSVCILTVMMKRMRKSPARVSSKYHILSYVAGS